MSYRNIQTSDEVALQRFVLVTAEPTVTFRQIVRMHVTGSVASPVFCRSRGYALSIHVIRATPGTSRALLRLAIVTVSSYYTLLSGQREASRTARRYMKQLPSTDHRNDLSLALSTPLLKKSESE